MMFLIYLPLIKAYLFIRQMDEYGGATLKTELVKLQFYCLQTLHESNNGVSNDFFNTI